MTPKFKALMQNGKPVMEGHIKDSFDGYLKKLSGFVEVVIKPWSEKKARSNNQNAYMWGVVYKILSDETGYSIDDVHEICKIKFNSKFLEIDNGMIIGASTTSLTTSEMEEYLAKIRSWASLELGINIPEPGEISYET